MSRATFYIQPRDAHSNVTAEPPKAFKALLVRTGENGDEEDGGNVSMSAGPDGSSVASYVPRLAGEWQRHVRLRRVVQVCVRGRDPGTTWGGWQPAQGTAE